MNRRQRDVERMVTDLGLTITSWRTNGSGHWRVDVKAPNGSQRPFTFPTGAGFDGPRRFDELNMLRRWRREVMPELDAAEESGNLVPGKVGTLAEKLVQLGIPLKKEQTAFAAPPLGVSQIKAVPRPVPPFKKNPLPITPRAEVSIEDVMATMTTRPETFNTKPDTYTATLPTVKEQVAAATPKETTMQPHLNGDKPARKPHVQHKKREQMSFSEVMKFGEWMNKDRLEGYYVKADFLEHASKVLAFRVSDSALDAWLEDKGVSMPKRPEPVKQKTSFDWLSEDIAAIALALSEAAVPMEHKTAMLAIVERRTKG